MSFNNDQSNSGTYHVWGDEDFSWDTLYSAMNFISEELRKEGINICIKEKWGTIRYEAMWTLGTPEEVQAVAGILDTACQKFPRVAEEIMEDWEEYFD